MSGQVKILLGCAAALLVLSGALAAALLAPGAGETASAENTLTLTAGDVQSVTVNNEKGTVRLVRSGSGFAVEGLEDLPASDNAAELAAQAGGLEALREIPPAEDLEQFGLASPAVTASIELDGGSRRLELGAEAPSSSGRYAALDGKVYLIEDAALTAFDYGPEDYISLQVTDPLDMEEAVESITLEHGGEKLVFSYVPEQAADDPEESEALQSGESSGGETSGSEPQKVPAYYRMTAPVQMDLEKYDVSVWAGGAFGMSAQKVEAIRPDAAQLQKYGLDPPETVLTAVSTAGDSVKLLASAPENGSCYLMREGVPLIYRVSQADVQWRRVTAETLAKSVFPPAEPADIASLEITGQGAAYRFVRENGAVTMNGKSITEQSFEGVLDAVLHMPPEFLGEAASPALEPAAAVTVDYADEAREPDTLRLIPTGSGSLYMELNGEIRYTVLESYLQALLNACEASTEPASGQD